MKATIRQLSSLEKIFRENPDRGTEIVSAQALLGERFSYQAEICSDESARVNLSVESELKDCIRIYKEDLANCDLPAFASIGQGEKSDEYICYEPCRIPDILRPLEERGGRIRVSCLGSLFWIRVDVPKDIESKSYDIALVLTDDAGKEITRNTLRLTVLPHVLPEKELIYTQWFHTDCIAVAHGVEVYSKEHWKLIEAYMETAADCGINMLLTPVHTPPLDTKVGTQRPNVQLVRMEKKDGQYSFDFALLEKWVERCQKCGIRYLEIPQLFSQWGAKAAPNIYVWEDGEYKHMFGWHTASDSEEYTEFLKQYLPALAKELERLSMAEHTYFHISDEPAGEQMENYQRCAKLIADILPQAKVIDALSDVEFYRKGLVRIPVPGSNHIEPFLKEEIEERWVYYCCAQSEKVSNRFLAQSSYRNRVMGVLMYKFGMAGFLQWGYNFYFSQISEYAIDPYVTTSADLAFPSGDPFSVYPATGGALPSLRAFVFYEGLQDIALCRLLEERTSREFVTGLIDGVAKKDIRFDDLPEDDGFLFELRKKILTNL